MFIKESLFDKSHLLHFLVVHVNVRFQVFDFCVCVERLLTDGIFNLFKLVIDMYLSRLLCCLKLLGISMSSDLGNDLRRLSLEPLCLVMDFLGLGLG